ncbi:sex hormone-binding globulin [Lepisosteus oculatus]|uniref:sex hormone-binding globulin n=1 Tax=Lepisosteus oculatus TaxID=7918 RepID=UPI00371A9ADA
MRRIGALVLIASLAAVRCRSSEENHGEGGDAEDYLTGDDILNLGQQWGTTEPFTTMTANLSDVTSIKSSFQFRTLDSEGVVFYGDTKAGEDWFVLALRGGIPEMQIGKSSSRVSVSGGPRLDDGRWHQVQLRSENQFVVLEVDRVAVLTVGLHSVDDSELLGQIRLALGGILVDSSLLFPTLRPEMDGCIRGGTWLNLSTPWVSTLRTEPKPCFANLIQGSYFLGTGLALFQSTDFPLSPENRTLTVEVSLRPERWSGTVLAVQTRDHRLLLSLSLDVSKDCNELSAQLVVFTSTLSVHMCLPPDPEDNLVVVISEKEAQIRTGPDRPPAVLEDMEEMLEAWEKGALLSFGGMPDGSDTNGPADQSYFRGCMYGIRVQGRALDLDRSFYKHGSISSHSCPKKKIEKPSHSQFFGGRLSVSGAISVWSSTIIQKYKAKKAH